MGAEMGIGDGRASKGCNACIVFIGGSMRWGFGRSPMVAMCEDPFHLYVSVSDSCSLCKSYAAISRSMVIQAA